MNENKEPFIKSMQPWQLVLVGLAVLSAIVIGLSFVIYTSPYAPLFILAGVIAIIAIFTWLQKPVWALYFTLFIVLLPTNLIPAQINSYLNRAASIIALSVWVIDVIRKPRRIIITPSAVLMFLFIVWSIVSLVWAGNLEAGKTVLQQYILRLIVFLLLVTNEVRSTTSFRGFMRTLALSGWLLIAVSFATIIVQGYTSGTRLQVLAVNENALGLSLLLTLPAVFWLALNQTNSHMLLRRIPAALFLIACFTLIGLSGSRGSAISLGVTLLAFLFWKPTRIWGIFSLIIIAIAFAAVPIVFSTTLERFLGAPGETILGGREVIWPAAWQLIKDHLLLGVGIANSRYEVIPYLANLGIIGAARYLSYTEGSLHNPLLVIWAETGILGLLLYVGVLISAVISYLRHYIHTAKKHKPHLMLYYALISSVFLGYMASWIKGGGLESDFSYFLMLAFLLIPVSMDLENL